MVSTIRRSDGSGGKIQVPRETYSLRISFWVVPVISRRHALALGHRQIHREQDRGGSVDRERGADSIERDTLEQNLHVGQRVDRDPYPADVVDRLRGRPNPSRAGLADRAPPRCRSAPAPAASGSARSIPCGVRESAVLAHRPKAPAMHGRLHAAGERVVARKSDILMRIGAKLWGGTERVQLQAG